MKKLMEDESYEFCFLDIDIVEHSKILSSNPPDMVEKALDEFEKYVEEKVELRDGTIWCWQGDGGLAVFYGEQKSRNSVLCAMEILDGLATFNLDRDKKPIDEDIKVRIGINKGVAKYREEHGRIHSAAINFVAHLQKNFSEPNSIAISKWVYSELLPKQKEKFFKVGYFQNQEIYKRGLGKENEQTEPGILHPDEKWAKPWTQEEEEIAINSIADSIIRSGWSINYIVSIFDPDAMGGAMVGGKLLDLLRKHILPSPRLLPLYIEGRDTHGHREVTALPPLPLDVDKPNILMVDDVAFTGRTLKVAYGAIMQKWPDAEVKFATIAVGKELEEEMTSKKTPIHMKFPYKVIYGNRVLFTWGKVSPTGTLREIFNIQYPNDNSFSRRMIREWGYMEIFALKKKAFVRILTTMPSQRLSYQRHKARDEYFVALDDGLNVELDFKPPVLARKGDYIMIPRGTWHRFSNSSSEPARSLEVAFGDKYDQNDIERCEDDYGRPKIGDKLSNVTTSV